jgi:hypothetical protein
LQAANGTRGLSAAPWNAKAWREQAKRAEAEELLARNALADALQHIDEMYQNADYWRERAERAERLMQGKDRIIAAKSDALARVRALCDEIEGKPYWSMPDAVRSIRAAIDEEGGAE